MQRFFLVALIIINLSDHAYAQDSGTQLQEPDDNQLRLLNVYLERINLDQIIATYQIKDNLMVPLGALADFLDLAINVSPENGTASGFVLQENNRFFLDAARNEVTIVGKTSKYQNDLVVVYFDDIYVESRQLSEWFPFSVDVDLYSLVMYVRPSKLFPKQLRKIREKRIKQIRRGDINTQQKYPRQKIDYELFSYPFIDQTIGLNANEYEDRDGDADFYYSTYATADLFYMESSLYLAGDSDDSIDEYRLTLGRKDPDADLLGPLHATEFMLGNISMPSTELIAPTRSSDPGLMLSNFPLFRQQNFDTHSFEGNLLPGWDVELYRNNELIDYQPDPIDGQYRFIDVPLLFGSNFFRLVFYGPNGQQREETYEFNLGNALTRPGDQLYRFSAVEDEDSKEDVYKLDYNIGLNKYASVNLGLVSLPLNDGRHQYSSLGLISYWKSLFFNLNHIEDNQGGRATELDMQTKLSQLNIKLNHVEFDEFSSEIYQSDDLIESQSNLRFDSAIPAGWLPRIPITLEYDQEEFSSGHTRRQWQNRISSLTHGFSISNLLTRVEETNRSEEQQGQFQVSYHRLGMNFRGNVDYQLKPLSEVNEIGLDYDGYYIGPYRLGLGFTHFSDDEQEYNLELSKLKGEYSLSLSTTYDTSGELNLNLTASINLGRNPSNQQWHREAESIATEGAILATAFLDENQNGSKDDEEQGLSNVSFNFNGIRQTDYTNEQGQLFVTQIKPHVGLDLNLAADTLEDPLWLPAVEGIQVVPRPGQTAEVIFPVIMTGEVDGTVYIESQGKERPAGNVELQLVDQSGRIITRGRSAYDGFYILSEIPIGTYRLQVAPRQVTELGLDLPEPRLVTISPDQIIIYGQDFILQRQ